MNLKVFVVLVGLLAALALFALGRGFTRGPDPPGAARASWADRLGALLVHKQALAAGDVQDLGACLEGDNVRLAAGGTCLLRLRDSRAPVRELSVTAPQAFAAVLEQPGRVTVRAQDRELKADVYRDGGTLSLGCPLAACTLHLFTPLPSNP